MQNTRPLFIRAHLGMLLWALIVGLSFPAVGLMSEGLPPLLLTALRFAVAVLALGPLVGRTRDPWPGLPGGILYAVMGVCLAAFFGGMFWAAHRATALSMATLSVSVPLLAYGLGRAFGVESEAGRLPGILLLGAAGALGLAWAEQGGPFHGLRFGAGEAVFFAGCIGYALYAVLSKWGLERGWLSKHAATRAFWSLLAGSLVIGVLGLFQETPQGLAAMSLLDIALLVYLGIFSTSVTFWILQGATAVLTPAAVTAYGYLVPVVSVLLLFMEQPDRLGWSWAPGSAMVLLAIVSLLRRDAV